MSRRVEDMIWGDSLSYLPPLIMSKKEIQNILQTMDDRIDFIVNPHSYVDKLTGKKLTGITSIQGQIDKPFLAPWASKENYNYMMKNWDISKKYSKEEKRDLLYKAKNAYREKSSQAKELGTKIHSVIEKAIKGEKIDPNMDKNIKRALELFMDWSKDIKWIASEAKVMSEKCGIAGTLDALGVIDGKLTLVDFKTSKMISRDYYIQTSGYHLCLEENGIIPEQRMIVKIPKYENIDFEAKIVPTPLDFDIKVFKSLIHLKKWIGYCNNKEIK